MSEERCHSLSLTHVKAESEAPASSDFAERETARQRSGIGKATKEIEQPQAAQGKNAFLAPIRSIEAIALTMMHARSREVTDPPHRQKEGQQQTLQACFILDQACFPLPSSTFALGSGRLNPHAPSLCTHTTFACFLVRKENPAFLKFRHPTHAHIRFAGFLLPPFGPTRPLLPTFANWQSAKEHQALHFLPILRWLVCSWQMRRR